jgi:endonuclease YncB( thermonuclease family)
MAGPRLHRPNRHAGHDDRRPGRPGFAGHPNRRLAGRTRDARFGPRTRSGLLRDFGRCGLVRVTCVVDGDTFWLDGTKYRIADINTPEISSPQCAREADLGRRATERLAELLNAGPFTLSSIDRDEDQYGRKLRIVSRDGQSLGLALVAEGLAHEWQGYRQGWC